jgi:hypothetical protein
MSCLYDWNRWCFRRFRVSRRETWKISIKPCLRIAYGDITVHVCMHKKRAWKTDLYVCLRNGLRLIMSVRVMITWIYIRLIFLFSFFPLVLYYFLVFCCFFFRLALLRSRARRTRSRDCYLYSARTYTAYASRHHSLFAACVVYLR